MNQYDYSNPLHTSIYTYLQSSSVIWCSIDILTAYFLSLTSNSNDAYYYYLLNPLTILTTLSKSSITIQNLLISVTIGLCYKSQYFFSLLSLSLCSIFYLYPIGLLPFVLLFIYNQTNGNKVKVFNHFITFILISLSLLLLSRSKVNDWKFMDLYRNLIFCYDLTPNVGLYWYLLMETFDNYRSFFLTILQTHAFIHILPLTFFLHSKPLLGFTLSAGILSIFKSYPSIGDTNIYITLLSINFTYLFECKLKFV